MNTLCSFFTYLVRLPIIGVVFFLLVSGISEGRAQGRTAKAEPKVEYVSLRTFKSDELAEEFLVMARRKQLTGEEQTVIARLLQEKQDEYAQIEQLLLQRYSVSAALEYEYDADQKMLFRKEAPAVEPVPGTAVLPDATQRRPVYEFKTPEGEQDFLQLVAAKRLTSNAVTTLKLLVLEKEKEMLAVDEQLKDRFGVLAEKNYYYDASKKTLFEVRDRAK